MLIIPEGFLLFTFFGTKRHFLKEKNSKVQTSVSKKTILHFLSYKYSADFNCCRFLKIAARHHAFQAVKHMRHHTFFPTILVYVTVRFSE